PAAVTPVITDEPVDQRELARDLRGPPLVQRRPVLRAQAVVVGLAVVRRERAPPALPAVRALRHLLDDPGVGQHPQVIAGRPGVLAQRLGDGGRRGRAVLIEVPQYLPTQRVRQGLPALGVADHPARSHGHPSSLPELPKLLCRNNLQNFLCMPTVRAMPTHAPPAPAPPPPRPARRIKAARTAGAGPPAAGAGQ